MLISLSICGLGAEWVRKIFCAVLKVKRLLFLVCEGAFTMSKIINVNVRTQPPITYSKLTTETLEQGVRCSKLTKKTILHLFLVFPLTLNR